MASDRCLGDRAERGGKVGSTPKRRQPRAKMPKFGSQNSRPVHLDLADEFNRSPPRVSLDEHRHVIRHHFARMHRHIPQGGSLTDQFDQPCLNAPSALVADTLDTTRSDISG
jgi:hypothetical protein